MSFESPPAPPSAPNWPSAAAPIAPHPIASAPKRAMAPLARGLQAIGVGIIAALAVGLAAGLGTTFIGLEATCTGSGDEWCELGWVFLGLGVALIAGAIGYLVAGCVWVWKHEPEGRRAVPTALHVSAPVVAASVLGLVSYFERVAF